MIKRIDVITENELNQIMKIWLNCNIDAHNFISEKYWQDNYDYVKDILPSAELFAYYKNNVIIGFLGLTDNYIAGIFINKEFCSLSIGTKLLDTIKKKRSILNLSVYEKNKRAINFYLKNGFLIKDKAIDTSTDELEYQMQWNKQTVNLRKG
ncbi:GNAT family N-acetyltransferase [Liquorilactobacillus capillatus]|uniref:Acetyltransferase n=1 Tax=Liquorilactobacillus capillatus DSM 19910 TaxID=1423731 RepID=A0A0R1M7Y6_9LACO|nr:GNAT family N-acetyltransferase [Liquorilactobacillus capillatus]KRL01173.1 acetyltransferase [Liquorilactobacillus capillatus DSM 19910]